jgi:hypothetical protein
MLIFSKLLGGPLSLLVPRRHDLRLLWRNVRRRVRSPARDDHQNVVTGSAEETAP